MSLRSCRALAPTIARRWMVVALTIVSLALAACGSGGGSPFSGIAHPRGDALVLRVSSEGGFIAPGAIFARLPDFTLLGDGRVVVTGAVEAIFPGPAMLPLQVRRLTESGMQSVLRAVAATGLFADSKAFNGARNVLADAATTVFTLHADGREVTISVYGLGTLDASNLPPGIADAELAAHRSLSSLAGRLSSTQGWLEPNAWTDPAWQPYRADALRLLVRNADVDPPDQSGIGNQLAAWPSGGAATFGDPTAAAGSRCGVVVGAEESAWVGALEKANQLTRYVASGHRYEVLARPLLPDEPRSCPAPS